jgi:hypothetical protein
MFTTQQVVIIIILFCLYLTLTDKHSGKEHLSNDVAPENNVLAQQLTLYFKTQVANYTSYSQLLNKYHNSSLTLASRETFNYLKSLGNSIRLQDVIVKMST